MNDLELWLNPPPPKKPLLPRDPERRKAMWCDLFWLSLIWLPFFYELYREIAR